MNLTEQQAVALATTFHAGQVDKVGAPYIQHPLRVMARLTDPIERIVAVLHDTIEDTALTLAELAAQGASPTVIDALDAISKRDHETNVAYIARVKANPIAANVKLADLADNMSPLRQAALDERTQARLTKKYTAALEALSTEGLTG